MINLNINKAGEAVSSNAVPFRRLSNVISFQLQVELGRKLYLGGYDARAFAEHSLKRQLTRIKHGLK
jgi:hypothetical protein